MLFRSVSQSRYDPAGETSGIVYDTNNSLCSWESSQCYGIGDTITYIERSVIMTYDGKIDSIRVYEDASKYYIELGVYNIEVGSDNILKACDKLVYISSDVIVGGPIMGGYL